VSYALAPRDSVRLRFRVPPASVGRRRTYFVQAIAWVKLATTETAQPDRAAADALMSGPGSLARFAVMRANALLEPTGPSGRRTDRR
jgi:hypothetical protein